MAAFLGQLATIFIGKLQVVLSVVEWSSNCSGDLLPRRRYRLEDDPMCGVTTGGQEDCHWDCHIVTSDCGILITNPECLLDCYPEVLSSV